MTIPRFLADENIRRPILHAVRRIYPPIEIVTVQELGLAGTADADLLDFADEHGRIMVSHDVNTMRTAAQERLRNDEGMAGLFLVPFSRATLPVAESLAEIAGASEAEEWQNAIVYLPL